MPQVAFTDFIDRIRTADALASFPTDTVPALAARPDLGDRIYQAKGRSPDKPLILMGASFADLLPFITGPEADIAQWRTVTQRYWPGALTLVLPASDRLPMAMNPLQTGTVGIRVPAHPLARHILAQTGPLATTSVNRSGQPALTRPAAIAQEFPAVWMLSEAAIATLQTQLGPFDLEASGIPSTVVQWQPSGWTVLRQGGVPWSS